jgi:hypothetical protein
MGRWLAGKARTGSIAPDYVQDAGKTSKSGLIPLGIFGKDLEFRDLPRADGDGWPRPGVKEFAAFLSHRLFARQGKVA